MPLHLARQIHRYWLTEEALKFGIRLLESLDQSGRIQNEIFASWLRGLDIEFGDSETRLFLSEWQNCIQTTYGKELITIDLKRAIPSLFAWMSALAYPTTGIREPVRLWRTDSSGNRSTDAQSRFPIASATSASSSGGLSQDQSSQIQLRRVLSEREKF